MKNYIIYTLSLITLLTSISCKKKDDFHKITYEVTFLDQPSKGYSDFLEVQAKPSYSGSKEPNLTQQLIPKVWKYDYYQLKTGDKVLMRITAQLSYEYKMKIYIDDVEVSYLHVLVSDDTYFDDTVIDRSGLNIYSNASTNPYGIVEDTGIIGFTYQ